MSETLKQLGYDSYSAYVKAERNTDFNAFGRWQILYGKMIRDVFGLQGRRVLDVGCAAGAAVKSFVKHGADAYGVDPNRFAIENTAFDSIRHRLTVADADQIGRMFPDESFDLIHSQQVFEHFPSRKYSAEVVRQSFGLLKPGGLIYVALVVGSHVSAGELLDQRAAGHEVEVTHINVWPMDWWLSIFRRAGFQIRPDLIDAQKAWRMDGWSFWEQYHWDQIIAQRP